MAESTQSVVKRRTRVSRPYPQHRLSDVLEIAQSIQENNSGLAFDRVRLAKSMGTTPSSSAFMMKLNSSAKYGLTEGGYSDPRISLTALGARAAVADTKALVEAVMGPDTFKRFYELLDGKRIPAPNEASGVIVDDVGIPEELASEFLKIVVENGELVGIVTEVGNSHYVSLTGLTEISSPESASKSIEDSQQDIPEIEERGPDKSQPQGHMPARAGRLLVVHSGAGAVADRIVRMLDDISIPHGIVEIDPIDSSPLSAEWTNETDESSGAIVVMAGPSRVVSTPGVASSRASKMLLQLGAAVDQFKEQVVMVLGPDGDHFLQTARIQRVHVDVDDSGRFELDLLRGLLNAKMMVVSIPGQ